MRITVRVHPNAKRTYFERSADGSCVAHVRATAVDGGANEQLLKLIATHLKVKRWQVMIVRGARSRTKLIEVDV
ncbi:MAG: DUF167 domain-containing protein [Candidatus Uhrbacteria bacterium]